MKRAEFLLTQWPRRPEELNTPAFRAVLSEVVNDLRRSVLKDLPSMHRYCSGGGGAIEGGTCCQNYGFTLETGRYLYRLRCNPIEGDYQAYLSCFNKQAQQMHLTESGQQPVEPAPVIGRITYAHDGPEEFTDPKKYLAAIWEELPYHAATGFRCETLTDDPAIRKAVDDMLCDFYGEENPRSLEDYGGMTMGGMGG